MKKWMIYIAVVGLSIPLHLFAQEPNSSNDAGSLNLSKKEMFKTTVSKPSINITQRVKINEATAPVLTKSEKEKLKSSNQPLTPISVTLINMNLSAKEKRALGL